ncbi:hypothetical protein I79_011129 [Cricetulus griseus]|uniref:Uncharacterized protein n=1 Tax=Cricetulus griseus TaxID=10029 RepID=G3HKB1_CRIGR|nr:hypothetical protein I79_011129 [Cricetulus griseus]
MSHPLPAAMAFSFAGFLLVPGCIIGWPGGVKFKCWALLQRLPLTCSEWISINKYILKTLWLK